MAAYEYTAIDAAGREKRGVLEGDSARLVRALLREQALLPVTVTEISDAPPPRAFQFSFTNRIGVADLALLTRQLSTLVRAGIPLEEVERCALVEALKMSNWIQKDAAQLLSISPRVINYKIKTLGIQFPRGRRAQPLEPTATPL